MKTEACPPESALDEFAHGGLPQPAMDAVAAHVVRCRACDGRLAEFVTGLPVTKVGPVPTVRPLGSNAAAGPVLVGGRYLLGERLGAGGMGFVFRAEQTHPVRRPVAIKVIKPGMDTDEFLARFEAERRTVARMDHPNIARVYDAGATDDGRPYLALELIDGQPLVRYCDARKLTVARRVDLFVPVCRAVQHAHQKGVIHRDLKPSNILVAEVDGKPVPKVIDFGIAKAVGGDTDAALATRTGAVVGTPEYMSPEQAGLSGADIDTRSDVYSLGVVLYELLTGTPPFTAPDSGGSVLELLRRIREVDAPRPGSQLRTPDTATRAAAARGRDPERLRKELAGELEWVVMTALEKDRDRRYQSAAALADDLERYLRQEPLAAGPPSRRYRLRKFLLRNRRAVFAASAVAVALIAGTVGACVGLVRSLRAERDAVEAHGRETEARIAAEAAAAQARADHELAVRAGEEARRDREVAVAAQARTRAALLAFTDEVVGGLLGRAAQLTPEEERFLKSVERRLAAFADETGQNAEDRAAAAECRGRLGTIQVRLGELASGKASLRAAADAMGRFTGGDATALRVRAGLVGTAGELGVLCLRTNSPEAVGWMDAAVRVAEELVRVAPTADHRGLLAQALGSRGNCLMRSGQTEAAVNELTAAHALLADLHREDPATARRRYDLASNHDLLGRAYDVLRRGDDAVREWRAAERLLDPLVGRPSGEVKGRAMLAAVLSQLARAVGRTDAGEADRCYRRAIALRRQLATDYPAVPQYRSDYAASAANYAGRLIDDGRWDDAERFAADALAMRERLAADFPTVSTYRIYLAHNLVLTGRLARHGKQPGRAAELLARAAQVIGPVYEKEPDRPLAREIYTMCVRERGELHDDAEQFPEAADDWRAFRKVAGRKDESWAVGRLARSLAKAGRGSEAAAELESLRRPDWGDAGWVIARAHAVIAEGATDPAGRERHAAAAVQALKKAGAAGLENPAEARTEPDFDALRDRADFRAVLDTLRERLPPPRSVRDEG